MIFAIIFLCTFTCSTCLPLILENNSTRVVREVQYKDLSNKETAPPSSNYRELSTGTDNFALATRDCSSKEKLDFMYSLMICEKTSEVYLISHLPTILIPTHDFHKLDRFLQMCVKPTQLCFDSYGTVKQPEFRECAFRVTETSLNIKFCISEDLILHSAVVGPQNIPVGYKALRRLRDRVSDARVDKINRHTGLVPNYRN